MTLGQGHGKIIQYISPDPYGLCAKYQRFSSNGYVCGRAIARIKWPLYMTEKHETRALTGDLHWNNMDLRLRNFIWTMVNLMIDGITSPTVI